MKYRTLCLGQERMLEKTEERVCCFHFNYAYFLENFPLKVCLLVFLSNVSPFCVKEKSCEPHQTISSFGFSDSFLFLIDRVGKELWARTQGNWFYSCLNLFCSCVSPPFFPTEVKWRTSSMLGKCSSVQFHTHPSTVNFVPFLKPPLVSVSSLK